MRRWITITSLLAFLWTDSSAQQFWMLAKRGVFKSNEPIVVAFMMSAQFSLEYSTDKVPPFNVQWLTASATKNITKEVKLTRDNNLQIKPAADGIQVISFQGKKSVRDWNSEKFEAYVDDNGLESVKASVAGKVAGRPVREEYQYLSKLIIQVGDKADDTYKKWSGLRLEIVPEKNPCTLAVGDYLQCKVLLDGKPSPHTLVKVWSRINSTSFVQNIYTEDDGTMAFPISTKGPWMVSSVGSVASTAADGADWLSFHSSLTFIVK